MPEFAIRAARSEDAPGIARVQVQGWREAYTGRMPQSIIDDLDTDRATGNWRGAIERAADPDAAGLGLWVAEAGGDIIGFVCAGDGRDEDAPSGRREIFAIYVLAAHYGTGAGQALMDAAIGDAAASLWVLEDNPRARAFYRRNRFEPDGAVKDDDRWGEPVHEVRLVRPAN
ncbi:MAG TPA: GNAT family N-acetyltransferase [Microbacterium sp.]|nr:GNAT family N-acetyltransferase [Microbacterium sp.]